MECIGIAHNCRACQIKTEEESEKIFIFNTVKLPDIFKDTTSLDIQENDGLPKILCCSCYDRLLEAYNFRKMCYAAALHFHKILSMDIPEKKYVPPESLSNDHLINGTQINLNAEEEVSNAPNSLQRNIDCSPDREDFPTDISDVLPIDETLPDILKTDLDDDVTEEENVPSARQDDALMGEETENAFPEKDNRHIRVSRKPRRRKLRTESDDDVPLISRKLRKVDVMGKETVPSESQDDASMSTKAKTSKASLENSHSLQKDDRPIKVSKKPGRRKLQKDCNDVPLISRKLRNADVMEKEGVPSERQDDSSMATEAETTNTSPEKHDRPIKISRKLQRRKLRTDSDDVPLISRKLRSDDVMNEEAVPSEKQDDASMAREAETSNHSPENSQPPEQDDRPIKVSSKPRRRRLQRNSNDVVPLTSRKLRNYDVKETQEAVSSEKQDDATMTREAETTNASPGKYDRPIKISRKPQRRKLRTDSDDVPLISRKLRSDDVMDEEAVPSERQDDATMARKAETKNTSPENSQPPKQDDRPFKVSNKPLRRKLQRNSNDDVSLTSKKHKNKRDIKPFYRKGTTKLKCSICKSSFSQKYDLRLHIRTVHLGLKSYQCIVCKKEFTSAHNLNTHLNVHEITKGMVKQKDSTQCDVCGVQKVTPDELTEHIKTHKKCSKWCCPLCPYKAVKKYILVRHVKITHKGVREYHCPQCGKSFTGAPNLEEHILRHEGIKNYVCHICGARKVTQSALLNHMPTHYTEKVSCAYCSLIFTRTDNLKQHVKIVHQKIKKYQCAVCNKAFGVSRSLKDHLMTHSGEKPHVCSECGMSFIRQTRLNKHMRTRHNAKKPRTQNTSSKLKTQDNSRTPRTPNIQGSSKKPIE